MQIRRRQHNSNKGDTSYVRTYPEKNWKIYKTLVYYRTRARKNRKIASAWNSMGLGKWKERIVTGKQIGRAHV